MSNKEIVSNTYTVWSQYILINNLFKGKKRDLTRETEHRPNVFNNKVHYIISATVRGPDLSPNAANCQHRSADMLVRSVHPMFQKCFTKQMCVEEFNSKWISRISIMLNSLFIIFFIALHPMFKNELTKISVYSNKFSVVDQK